ncbi:MAG: hypothetical protein ACJ779_11600 [Chloroflexota bacterium]
MAVEDVAFAGLAVADFAERVEDLAADDAFGFAADRVVVRRVVVGRFAAAGFGAPDADAPDAGFEAVAARGFATGVVFGVVAFAAVVRRDAVAVERDRVVFLGADDRAEAGFATGAVRIGLSEVAALSAAEPTLFPASPTALAAAPTVAPTASVVAPTAPPTACAADPAASPAASARRPARAATSAAASAAWCRRFFR